MSLDKKTVESWVSLQMVPPHMNWDHASMTQEEREQDPWRVLLVPSTQQYRVVNVETGEQYRLTVKAEVTLEEGP